MFNRKKDFVFIPQGKLVILNDNQQDVVMTGLGPCIGLIVFNKQTTLAAHLDSAKRISDLSSEQQFQFIQKTLGSLIGSSDLQNSQARIFMGDCPLPESARLSTHLQRYFLEVGIECQILNTKLTQFNKSGSVYFNTTTYQYCLGYFASQIETNMDKLKYQYDICIDNNYLNLLKPLSATLNP